MRPLTWANADCPGRQWEMVAPRPATATMIGSNLSWMRDRAEQLSRWRNVEAMVTDALADHPPSSDVIWLGSSKFLFPYSVTFNWPGRQELAAVPPLKSERAPTVGLTEDVIVCRGDERTLVARSATPFSIGAGVTR